MKKIRKNNCKTQLYLDVEINMKKNTKECSSNVKEPSVKQNIAKRADARYRDLPVGLTETRGCRYKFYTRKGNPIGQIKCCLKNKNWASAMYGDKRTRQEAIAIVFAAKLKDQLRECK